MNNITRDVVTDLLPLYFAGEASTDSRAVVETFFREHPDFEKLARRSIRVEVPVVPGPEAIVEKEVLGRVRRTLRARSVLQGLALFFMLVPFSVYGDSHGVRWWMLRDLPGVATAFAVVAAVFWGAYLLTFRKLRDTR